jgi:hypothetical protein
MMVITHCEWIVSSQRTIVFDSSDSMLLFQPVHTPLSAAITVQRIFVQLPFKGHVKTADTARSHSMHMYTKCFTLMCTLLKLGC